MRAMRPDEIQERMDKMRRKELRGYIFLIIMLVIAPIVVIAGMIASALS